MSTNPVPPYASWATAATNIHQAVDAAVATDLVVVSNGVYAGSVSVTNPLMLLSANGPQFTVIDGGGTNRCISLADGASLTGFTLTGGNTNIGRVSGPPVDRLATGVGGGVFCSSTNACLTNCTLIGNSANYGGGAYGGTLYNCTFSNNSAKPYTRVFNGWWTEPGQGGGACNSALYNSILTGNRANFGGGADSCTLYNCRLSDNSVFDFFSPGTGGLPVGNTPGRGGGVLDSRCYNCTLTGNSSTGSGGGVYDSMLYNCTLNGNWARDGGGGAHGCTLYNCTLAGNSAELDGGGAGNCALNNCVIYYNAATAGAANYDSTCVLNYCCTVPLPAHGVGNLALDPQLASLSHLSANSPCRGAGSAAYAIGTDLDGEVWANPPSIGSDEYHASAATGPLTVSLQANYTHFAAGYPATFTATIEGRTTENVWDFGDAEVAINRPVITHAWTEPGEYRVALRAFNDSHREGVSATLVVVVDKGTNYVASGNSNPVYPYRSWATAATNIQDAVDASAIGGLVIVTNGTYANGGRPATAATLTNRVAVEKPLTLLSVNGPESTVIQGFRVSDTTNEDGAVRCVYLANGAVLSGFTLTNGATLTSSSMHPETCGGGIVCKPSAIVSNCLILGNWASFTGGGVSGGSLYNCTLAGNSASYGGGADSAVLTTCTLTRNSAEYSGGGAYGGTLYGCTLTSNSTLTSTVQFAQGGGGVCGGKLYNCTLTGNSANTEGGGASQSTLINCTLAGNSAKMSGGGACSSALYNCIIYYNTAPESANYQVPYPEAALLYSCCTTPLPTPNQPLGNIIQPPSFVANGNLRLQSNSPCINSGNNAYVSSASDRDGNPRIVSGTVDIGAYEYQGTGSVISYAWLQQFGLPTDGSADYADPDHDGLNNCQEWRCLTSPTNVQSALRLRSPSVTGTKTTVTWESVAGVRYFLEGSTNPISSFMPLATSIIGQSGTTSYTDTNATGAGLLFYRVGVKHP